MFRRWLISLLHRPRVSETAVHPRVAASDAERKTVSQAAAFQPIRSQEEIEQEEEENARKHGMMAKLFEDRVTSNRVRSRPSHRANEAP